MNFGLFGGGPEAARWVLIGHQRRDIGGAGLVGAAPAQCGDGDRRRAGAGRRAGKRRRPAAARRGGGLPEHQLLRHREPVLSFNIADIAIFAGAVWIAFKASVTFARPGDAPRSSMRRQAPVQYADGTAMKYRGMGPRPRRPVVLAATARQAAAPLATPYRFDSQKPQAPDEFQVITRKPLQMPASADLPVPRRARARRWTRIPAARPSSPCWAARRAADAAPAEAAPSAWRAGAALGRRRRGGRPRNPADAAGGQDTQVLGQALRAADRSGELFTGGDQEAEGRLDPAAEARRLQREGVAAAPIDPKDGRPPRRRSSNAEQPIYPSTQGGRRPQNKLPSSGRRRPSDPDRWAISAAIAGSGVASSR